MVVQHNMQAANASRMLNITAGQQAKTTEKLASGYRINRAADDAAGLSISEKMRKQIRGLERASLNAEDGISMVQTAEGALTEVHSMLQRMNELAVQAANGTNQSEDRTALNDEVTQLKSEIDRVQQSTQFNNITLLDGTLQGNKAVKLQIGADNATAQQLDITIKTMSSKAIGLSSTAVTTQSLAQKAIDEVKAAIKAVSAQRSLLGATQNRLEHTVDNLDNVAENTTAAESRIRDTDMADAMVKFTKNNILQQAGQSMLAQANQSTQGVLSLLG